MVNNLWQDRQFIPTNAMQKLAIFCTAYPTKTEAIK